MSPIPKLYLLTILRTGIPAAIILTLFNLAGLGEISFWKFLIFTLLFGGINAVVYVSFIKKRLQDMDIDPIKNEHIQVVQRKRFSKEMSMEELLSMLRKDPYFKKMNIRETEAGIHLDPKSKWDLTGERIIINGTSPSSSGLQRIEVTSRPIFLNYLDGGRNLENIKQIEEILGSGNISH